MSSLSEKIFAVTPASFESVALEVFRFQYQNVAIYRQFCNSFNRHPETVLSVADIPFLPVEFFKNHAVLAEGKTAEKVFESSGTTGSIPSRHHVADLALYEKSFLQGFNQSYGPVSDYVFFALLPSYLERDSSSLVYMANKLIELSGKNASGFFLTDYQYLYDMLEIMRTGQRKTILLGVTFALLNFAEKYKIDFPELIVMETGGMKGRREELTREELHTILTTSMGVSHIHSEYGMTEMLSQAYSKGNGLFYPSPTMKIVLRDAYEPMRLLESSSTGGVNVIDLANLYSCSFIATGDLGKLNEDGSFEILGRLAQTELRGCNLMMV